MKVKMTSDYEFFKYCGLVKGHIYEASRTTKKYFINKKLSVGSYIVRNDIGEEHEVFDTECEEVGESK